MNENLQSTTVPNDASISHVVSLTERIFMFLEDSNWESANTYCEKLLDIEPTNAIAYLGKLMAEYKVSQKEQLGQLKSPLDDNNNYQKILRFGDEKLKSEITFYNEQNISRFNTAKQKKKRRTIMVISILSSICVIALFVWLVLTVIIPTIKYNDAKDHLYSKEYDKALLIFTELGDFKDSDEKIKECVSVVCNDAEILINNGENKRAYELLLVIGNYCNKETDLANFEFKYLKHECKTADNFTQYTYEYDADGRLLKEIDTINDELLTEYIYDENGNLIKESYGSNKYISSNSTNYVYSDIYYSYTDNKLTEVKKYDKNNNLNSYSIYTYEHGNLKEINTYDENQSNTYKVKYEYYDDGNLKQERETYYSDTFETVVNLYTYYDTEGKITKTFSDLIGTGNEYVYNENGQKIIEYRCTYFKERVVTDTYHYEYDNKGNLIRRDVIWEDLYEYDEYNNCTKEENRYNDGKVYITNNEYEYDSLGNIIAIAKSKTYNAFSKDTETFDTEEKFYDFVAYVKQ